MNRDEWYRRKELGDAGFELRPPGYDQAVYLHGRNESPRHLAVKAMVALALRRAGRPFGTEVKYDAGTEGVRRADVVDHGAGNARSVVYEVETGASQAKRKEKASYYASSLVRDCIVVDPAEAPWPPEDCLRWLLDNHVIGVGDP